MEQLMYINVNRFYEFNSIVEFRKGYTLIRKYHHTDPRCKGEFTATYEFHGMFKGGFKDYSVRCPICGGEAYSRPADMYDGISYQETDESVPLYMLVRLYEIKDGYQIRVHSSANKFIDVWGNERLRIHNSIIDEHITFDVKRRKTIYKMKSGRTIIKEIEIGNFYDNTFIDSTMLKYINCYNGSRESLKKFNEMLAIIRKGIAKKFKRFHGYELGNIYTRRNTVPMFGKLVPPITYIAFRMIFPDIRTMPTNFLGNTIIQLKDCPDNKLAKSKKDFMKLFDKTDFIRGSKNSIDGIIGAVGLPATTHIRQVVSMYPFHAPLLSVIYKRIPKADIACQIFNILIYKYSYSEDFISDVENLMNSFIMDKPISAVRSFLTDNDWNLIKDTIRMSNEYLGDKTDLFNTVKLSAAHAWLTEKIYQQKNPNYSLNVPEHIRRRLEMQKDSLKFFMPDTAYDLRAGGREFHNCVYRYAKDASKQKCCIVFMSDDNGKLVACLEIRNDKLVQAKLKFNAPVYANIAINEAVIKWCTESGIGINTDDVKTMKDKDTNNKAVA